MFITSEETQQDSPLQSLLEGAWIIQRLQKIEDSLAEKPSTHDDVQRAVTGGDE